MQYKTYGNVNNTPFLILHGWGGSSESWKEVAQSLGKDFFVIVPDIPCASRILDDLEGSQDDKRINKYEGNIGKDDDFLSKNNLSQSIQKSIPIPCNKAYTLDDYADLVKKLIDELGLKNFILLGHSNGGAIASKLVSRYPDLSIKKLILNNSAGIRKDRKRSMKRKIFGTISKLVKPIFSLPGFGKIRNLFYRAIGGQDYLEAEKNPYKKQTFLNMINSDLQDIFPKIKKEVLLIRGENDTYTPLADGKKISTLIPNSKLEIIKNVKHGIHLQNPEELVKIILKNINN